ncbi:MAG: SpaH/EbpB family LPXTG-anchored major pilin [Acetobacterium sp.]
MKRSIRILSLGLMFAMFFVMAITMAYAAPSIPGSTSVTIHKVIGTGEFTLHDHNGQVLTVSEIAALGTGAVENNTGVEFTVWSVPAGTALTAFAGITDQQVTDSTLTGLPVLVLAGSTHSFVTGTYYVRETKHPGTLAYQIGVPLMMELPALNVAGDAYLEALHLYPKDEIVSDVPAIDKDVKTKNQDHAGFDVGKVFDYLIYPKVPTGIKDYSLFTINEILPSTVDYEGSSVTVTYNGVVMTAGVDYTLAQDDVDTAGGGFTLTFKPAGLQKLETNRPIEQTLKDFELKFQAHINNTAVMGTNIYNDATLTYNNGYSGTNTTINVPPLSRPEVHTGGRQFITVDNITQTYLAEKLYSATFAVKNGAGQYMVQDTQGYISWAPTVAAATKISVNGANGTFEVKGLAYGDTDTPITYTLEEVIVPSGYVKMNDLNFNIDAASYGDPLNISDNTKVSNVKRPVIPPTGGIGTIIFLLTGLTMMGGAVIVFKRRADIKK